MARTKKSDLQKQENWEDRINRAKKVREDWKILFSVDKLREYFDGKQNPGEPAEDWITINKIYTHLKSQLPTLYDVDPYFYVKLKRSYVPDKRLIELWEKRGKLRGAFLNYLKGELKLKSKVRLAIQDAHFAYGVVKVHYSLEEVDNEKAGQPFLGEDGEQLKGEDGQPLLEPDKLPVNEAYKVSRIHPDDFLWDEDAGTLEDTWSWRAQRIRMRPSEALENPNYNKKAVRKMLGKGVVKDDAEKAREMRKKGSQLGNSDVDPITGQRASKKGDEIFSAWEIYDLKRGVWLTIAEGGEIPLMDEEPIPGWIDGDPFETLVFTERDDSPYPHPPLSPGIEPQDEYNKARSSIQKHRKRFNRKYEAVQTGLVDESELSKLEYGDDGTVIRVQHLGTVGAIQDAPLDQMRYAELNTLKQELIETLGGASGAVETAGIANADSATQAGILDKRMDIKEGDARSLVMDFVRNIARKLDQTVQAHITEDQALKVNGPQGEMWETVRTQDYEAIKGEYEYDVNIGANIPRLPQMERASWQAFISLLGQAPQFLLSKRLLKKTAEMHHIEDDALIDELWAIGQIMMGGQGGGRPGSQAGVSEEKPLSVVGGQAGGVQSLNQPGAGNIAG